MRSLARGVRRGGAGADESAALVGHGLQRQQASHSPVQARWHAAQPHRHNSGEPTCAAAPPTGFLPRPPHWRVSAHWRPEGRQLREPRGGFRARPC